MEGGRWEIVALVDGAGLLVCARYGMHWLETAGIVLMLLTFTLRLGHFVSCYSFAFLISVLYAVV